MSQYYRPKRSRNLYAPGATDPFKVSRSKVELFIDCPRCFYVDRRLGVGRPPGFPFNLNSAVDELLKREFDQYRSQGEPHPLITQNGIDAIPHQIDQLDDWRHNFTGVRYHHDATNLLIFGAIDDLWINSSEELIVVDYKATSKKEPILQLNDTWHRSYYAELIIQGVGHNAQVSNESLAVRCRARVAHIQRRSLDDAGCERDSSTRFAGSGHMSTLRTSHPK